MSDDAPKLRLKPKLISDAATPSAMPPAESAPTTEAANETPPAPRSAPPAPPATAVSETELRANPLGAPLPPIGEAPIGAPAVRLKPKPVALAAAPAPTTPSAMPPAVPAKPPAFVAAVNSPPASAPTAPPPTVREVDIDAAPPESGASQASAVPSTDRAATIAQANKKLGRAAVGIGVAGVVVFAAVGYLAYGRLKQEEADTQKEVAQEMENARKAIQAARAESEAQAPVVKTSSAPAPSPQPAAPAADPAPASKTPAAPTAKATPAESSAPVKPASDSTPEPSPAFAAWVRGLKITGLRTGAVPRILVDRATFAAGDVINSDLGIKFDGYDASRRMLRFKDATGAIVERRER
jgi:hypothetical protein